MKVGIVDLSSEGWSAGRTYTQLLVTSLRAAGTDATFLSEVAPSPQDSFPTYELPPERYFPGEWSVRSILGLGRRNRLAAAARAAGLDAIGPLTHPAMLSPGVRNVAWIPDFQPFFLTHLYSKQELEKVRQRTQQLLDGCDKVILSSEDSCTALGHIFPAYEAKARVLRFPSLFAFHPPDSGMESAARTFGLPPRFLLVANQFWRHKNHIIVPQALALLRQKGLDVPCVMTGLPADFRDKSNAVLSAVLQEIARQGVWDLCRVLGLVSRPELVSLLRGASALVQPSLFEGWNTTVQDARALGCPVIASDLPVHREQCPDSALFFPAENAAALAAAIEMHWAQSSFRPDEPAEAASLAAEKIFAAEHGLAAKAIFTA